MVSREADDFDDDFVTGLYAFGSGVSDGNRIGKDSAVDADLADVPFFEVRTDKCVSRSFDDLLDLPAAFAAGASSADESNQNFVAVLSIAEILGVNVNVRNFGSWNGGLIVRRVWVCAFVSDLAMRDQPGTSAGSFLQDSCDQAVRRAGGFGA